MLDSAHTNFMAKGIPEVMKELTEEFMKKTELSERAKIRLRMKALLDFISVDTTYPKVPGLDGRPPAPALPAIGQALQPPGEAPVGRLGAAPAGDAVTGIPLFPAPGLAEARP